MVPFSLPLLDIQVDFSDIHCEVLVKLLEGKTHESVGPPGYLIPLKLITLRLAKTESLAIRQLPFRFSYPVSCSTEVSLPVNYDSLYLPVCFSNFWIGNLPFTSLMDLRRFVDLFGLYSFLLVVRMK